MRAANEASNDTENFTGTRYVHRNKIVYATSRARARRFARALSAGTESDFATSVPGPSCRSERPAQDEGLFERPPR
jgi:hypothetical protein